VYDKRQDRRGKERKRENTKGAYALKSPLAPSLFLSKIKK
jgi:hypothetical protein